MVQKEYIHGFYYKKKSMWKELWISIFVLFPLYSTLHHNFLNGLPPYLNVYQSIFWINQMVFLIDATIVHYVHKLDVNVSQWFLQIYTRDI